ncbi:hypothetical protein CL1_1072 [Thermococcus cleftensis]|uniref:ASCH domain-containing protein n=1 Tax=Thermococcus cleftensis (strain DSM 27260 / KACC 17922 / CL1) TaxID=163003 RepID=I3ZU91_THECF|nr:DUF365 domain-containing protein [Thermococcus cleftensis]AFL95275.1 hypothetical protein CL1_1072 [Thermococcus cleftensis]
MEEKVVGVTFPVPKPFLDRILEEGKRVFVKPSTLRVKPGMKVVFYASREGQAWLGEAEVEGVEFLNGIEEIIEKYGDELFLTAKELRDYERERAKWHSRGRRPRPWMVLRLKNLKKYPKPVKPPRFIAVSGRYIKEREYKEILRKSGL